MKISLIKITLAFVALTWLVATQTMAGEESEGTIVNVGANTISIKDKGGKVRSFDVDSAAKITLDGKTAKLDALGVGSRATVTTETKNNKTVAVIVEAQSKLTQSARIDLLFKHPA